MTFGKGSKNLVGNGTITAKVENVQNTGDWAKAGIMIRETLARNSKYAFAFVTPTMGTALQQRTTTGGSAGGTANIAGLTAPYWLRLTRNGDAITAYQSVDGLTWTTLGTTTISMGANVLVGMAVCSVNNTTLNQSVFSHVKVLDQTSPQLSLTPGDGTASLTWSPVSGSVSGYRIKRATSANGPFTTIVSSTPGTAFVDTSLANGTPYYYSVTSLSSGVESAESLVVSVTPSASPSLISRALNGTAGANAEKATETAAMAFDGSTGTKWYTDINASTGWIRYQFGNGLAWRITRYQVTSANDVAQRDPKNWQFQGSNDGVVWTTLDTRTNELFPSRLFTKTYDFTNTTPYRWYRLNITANNGGSAYPIQISELSMLSAASDAGDKTPPVMTLPSNVSVNAPNDTGTTVNFSATATDGVSGSATVIAAPSSGSLFAVGNTSVACSATDALGNTATDAFMVTVNSPVMAWRLQHFGSSDNSGDAADSADPDGDGWTNQQEFIAGTEPENRSSLLEFSQVTRENGDTQLSFATVAGKTYRIERSDDLNPASWSIVQDGIAGTGGSISCTDANGAGLSKRFYRIVVK